MKYNLSVNMNDCQINSGQHLFSLLSNIPEVCDVSLDQISDEKRGLELLLCKLRGIPVSRIVSFIGFLRNGDRASVYFSDEAADEWVGYEQTSFPAGNDDIEFRLANGRPCFQKASHCVPLSVAIKVVQHFYETGSRGAWLVWDKSE